MAHTLQSLPLSFATLDPSRDKVIWCSSAFDALLGIRCADINELCRRLSGLRLALSVARSCNPSIVWLAQRPLEATLFFHSENCLTLLLQDRAAQACAHQRHLQDREQLLLTSRVLSIGEMATTLAHEINQPIGAAANLLQGLMMRLERHTAHDSAPKPQELTRWLAALQQACEQITFTAKVIARIREYTHAHTPQRQRLDLVSLLKTCVRLLDWELEREQIDVRGLVDTPPLWTCADETMLQQLFVNLMRNGIDAMRSCALNQRHLSIQAHMEGRHVHITISDTGSGLSANAEKNLFTPFVSSKPTGTGIGLNICRSFVEMHEGRLWFTRPEGPGTSFHVALPAHILQEFS
jgi:two-component system, LuxR family, sensor kinase FixL